MPEIRPFCGVHYNQALVSDLAAVVCSPYDIITPQMQPELYRRSEYNFVRLEFSRELPQDGDADNKYTRAAATLEQWLRRGVLITDELPAIYLHDHHFIHQGKECRRYGIIVTARLEDSTEAQVRPHEGTLPGPKSDRLNLLWALQTNTSSIFTLFEDRGRQVNSLLASAESVEPILDISTGSGERHSLRAITEAGTVNQICRCLASQPLYIADGHHRYESAVNYLQERRACSERVSGDEPFNFVMMTLVDIADPGLVILPAHRLVRGMPRSALDGLMNKLPAFFAVEELPLSMPDVWQQVDGLLAGAGDQVKLVLFGMGGEHLYVLGLRDFTAASQMMPYFHSELYKRLDVSILDHVILEKLLELTRDKEESCLGYSYDRLDAVNRVLEQEYQLAFMLRPLKAAVVKAAADAGDRMPRKSTYFYPKLPSGLVCHRLV